MGGQGSCRHESPGLIGKSLKSESGSRALSQNMLALIFVEILSSLDKGVAPEKKRNG